MSETETNWRKKTLFFIIVISALRLAVLPAMNLMPQDAYYWQYAKHPSIGYFDHPPMHAFTAILTTSIFGDNAFGIRLGPWLYSLGILILIYNLTRRIYGERGAFWAVILAGVTPLFSIGSGILTPDPPLLFFWTLAIYLGWRTITENKKSWWILTGFACGLALLSKYTAVFLFMGFGLYLISTKKGRRHLLTPWPYLGLLASIVAFLPQIIWNAQNEWASFTFQSTRRASELSRWRLDLFGGMVVSQLLVVSPVLFVGVVWASFKGIFPRRNPYQNKDINNSESRNHKPIIDNRYLYLSCFALLTLLFFSFVALRYWVKMNWLAPAYISGLILFVGLILQRKRGIKILKWAATIAIFETLALYILVLTPFIPMSGEASYWEGWRELASAVDSIRNEMPDEPFIAGWGYKVPSELRFYLEGKPETHSNEILGQHGLNYSYWTEIDSLIGKNCIFVADAREPFREEALIEKYFTKVEGPDTLRPLRAGKPTTTFRVWRCFGYTGS